MSSEGAWTDISIQELIDRQVLVINDGYRAKNAELSDSGLPFARAKNVRGGFSFEDADLLGEEGVARAGSKISEPGDVVFTSKGTVGRFAFVKPDTPRFVYSPQLCFWRVLDEEMLDRRFLYFWMHGEECRRQFYALKGQTDMADYISLRDQRSMVITIPPLGEQGRVTNVLGALDDKALSNQRRANQLEEVAALLFSAYFGQHINAAKLGERLSAPSRSDWKTGSLADIADSIRSSMRPPEQPNVTFEHFSIPAFDNGMEPEEVTGSDLLSAKLRLSSSNRVLLSKLNPHRWWRVWWPRIGSGGNAVCSSEFVVLSPREGVPVSYLFALLRNDDQLRDRILRHVSGTTSSRQRVTPRQVLSSSICIPDDGALHAWDTLAHPIYEHAFALRRGCSTLKRLRDALLPKLISGEIRVPDTADSDETVAAVSDAVAV